MQNRVSESFFGFKKNLNATFAFDISCVSCCHNGNVIFSQKDNVASDNVAFDTHLNFSKSDSVSPRVCQNDNVVSDNQYNILKSDVVSLKVLLRISKMRLLHLYKKIAFVYLRNFDN